MLAAATGHVLDTDDGLDVLVPSGLVLIGRHFLSTCRDNDDLDRLGASTDLHGASLDVLDRHACGLGGCHTYDHLARTCSRCESRGDVDDITERGEVVDGCAKSGRSNECLARVDSRSYMDGHGQRAAGMGRSLGKVDRGR